MIGGDEHAGQVADIKGRVWAPRSPEQILG
jgi:hypothetical protein